MELKDKRVLLGVTGSISVYKACDLVQRLKEEGAVVRVIMTHSASQLVHPNTFAVLTGYPVSVGSFARVESGVMEHIDLARWADVFLIAPCTAHTLGELANGLTGSLISLVYMAYASDTYIAPAMNSTMLEAPAVKRNMQLLSAKGDILLPTGEGVLACGEIGHGKLLDATHIVAYLKSNLKLHKTYASLKGKRVLISLGHTREKWDDVRFLSNRSSGKTGMALMRALQLAGAQVEVVAGVIEDALPPGIPVTKVETSADFLKEMLARQATADVVIMAAAIADFIPAKVYVGKQKGSKSLENLELHPFPNILQELGHRKPKGQILVGFALETSDAVAQAEIKMQERNCDAMVVNNPVDEQTGFGKNRVFAAILLKEESARPNQLLEMDKDELAAALLAKLDLLLGKSA